MSVLPYRMIDDEAVWYNVMVQFFLARYHLKHLQEVLNHGAPQQQPWEPDFGQQYQAEADATTIIERHREASV